MVDGQQALVEFVDGCAYLVETADGYTRGVWNEQTRSFQVEDSDGSVRLIEPSFINPKSELVAWQKIEE